MPLRTLQYSEFKEIMLDPFRVVAFDALGDTAQIVSSGEGSNELLENIELSAETHSKLESLIESNAIVFERFSGSTMQYVDVYRDNVYSPLSASGVETAKNEGLWQSI